MLYCMKTRKVGEGTGEAVTAAVSTTKRGFCNCFKLAPCDIRRGVTRCICLEFFGFSLRATFTYIPTVCSRAFGSERDERDFGTRTHK